MLPRWMGVRQARLAWEDQSIDSRLWRQISQKRSLEWSTTVRVLRLLPCCLALGALSAGLSPLGAPAGPSASTPNKIRQRVAVLEDRIATMFISLETSLVTVVRV